MIDKTAFFDELAKIGAISDEQAQGSLNRLDNLERSKPTLGQAARYAGLGAVAGPAVRAIGNAIQGRAPGVPMLPHLAGASFPGATGMNAVRSIAGSAVTGAITSGLLPYVHNGLNRRAEMNTLKSFMKQHEQQPQELPSAAPGPPGTEVSGKIAAAQPRVGRVV